MRLIDLQEHFNNNDVWHAFRRPDLNHDVYENEKNGHQFTVPINEEDIPDEYAELACIWLQIESPSGTPFSEEPHMA